MPGTLFRGNVSFLHKSLGPRTYVICPERILVVICHCPNNPLYCVFSRIFSCLAGAPPLWPGGRGSYSSPAISLSRFFLDHQSFPWVRIHGARTHCHMTSLVLVITEPASDRPAAARTALTSYIYDL